MEQENTPPIQETQTLQSQGRYSETPESLLPLHLEKMRLANMVLPKPSNKPAPQPIMNDSDQNQASRFTIKTDDETSHYATPFANRLVPYKTIKMDYSLKYSLKKSIGKAAQGSTLLDN